MGEKAKYAGRLQFGKRLRLEFHGARITLDGGLLACRELDGALGLTEAAPAYLRETRSGGNVQHELVPLLWRSVYACLAGYEDTNEALELAREPAIQAVVGRRALEKQAASTNNPDNPEGRVPRALPVDIYLAEVAVPREVFAAILQRLTRLRLAPG